MCVCVCVGGLTDSPASAHVLTCPRVLAIQGGNYLYLGLDAPRYTPCLVLNAVNVLGCH